MRNKFFRLVRTFLVLFCAFLSIWCLAIRFQSWAGERGADALLMAAGLGQKATPSPAPQNVTLSGEEDTASRTEALVADDGVVLFHQEELPALNVTPDPNRASNTVQEITLDGGAQIANFFVKDTSGSGLNLNEELQKDPSVQIKANGEVEVLIYHTHTSESYSDSFTGFYYTDMETRTSNPDKSVVAAGEALKQALEAKGIGVVHDTTVCDEMFNGSYSRSWEVIQSNLEKHPGIQVTIDVHRDSMTTEEGLKYKPTVEIGGRKAAQVMLLAGCNAAGDWDDFPDWQENLHLDLRVQQMLAEKYPGLARPMDFSDSKYNMNATHGSMLIEFGTEVNTVAEAKYSGTLVGDALGEVLLSCKQ